MSATSQLNHVFEPNGDNKMDLISAASLGDLSLVETILQNNCAGVNQLNSTGWTPLMYASHYGHYNVIRLLIQHNCDVDYRDESQGRTALMLAASNGHTRTIEMLLNFGKADKNIKDANGHDAIHYAKTCGHGNNKMIKALLAKGNGYELKGRSYSVPIPSQPSIKITQSSHITETPKRHDLLDSMQLNFSSAEQSSDLYNPCEPSAFSSASFWRPIRRQNGAECQVISTTMPPSMLDLTPSTASSASTPSNQSSNSSFQPIIGPKPIAGRKKSNSISNQHSTPMPQSLFHLLSRIDLIQYLDLFESNAIDFYSFLTLTDDDFKTLGITSFGHRKKMSIAQLRYHESVDISDTHENFLADYLLNERDFLTKKCHFLEEKIQFYEFQRKN